MTDQLKVGELFAGYGGLGMAVEHAFGARTAWFSEFDEAPSKILAHHYPDIPNHGDITKIDWAGIEPVDILSGGFPCQDVSLAGRRAGLNSETRSGLWAHFAKGIEIIRPKYVVAENVRGLLSASAASNMEPCPNCLGNHGDEPALRALGAVLGDLADRGYDAQWTGIKASDVGAPHQRYRVILLGIRQDVTHAEHDGHVAAAFGGGPGTAVDPRRRHVTAGNVRQSARGRLPDHEPGSVLSADSAHSGRHESAAAAERPGCITSGRRSGDPAFADSRSDRGNKGVRRDDERATQGDRPGVPDERDPGCRTAAVADDARRDGGDPESPHLPAGERNSEPGECGHFDWCEDLEWGDYEPAIRRWERVIGRPAPRPTEPMGRDNRERLSPRFTEWMMGLPDGWVSSPEIGISRAAMLKACGNGVVPQQAAAALIYYLMPLANHQREVIAA